MYIKYGSPVKMMEVYIAVLTKGICQSEENGSFLTKDYDVRKAFLAGSIKGRDVKCDFCFISVIDHNLISIGSEVKYEDFLGWGDRLNFYQFNPEKRLGHKKEQEKTMILSYSKQHLDYVL